MQIFHSINDFKQLIPSMEDTKAFLWDMDGTICNTESIHASALSELLEKDAQSSKFGVKELEEIGLGLTDSMVFEKFQKWGYFQGESVSHFLQRKSIAYNQAIEKSSPAEIFLPEIKDTLEYIKNLGKKLAVVTSSEALPTEKTLSFLNVYHLFDIIITQEHTEKNKPDPAPYLLAMEKLQVTPQEVFILEDSPAGLNAAKASGANFAKVCWY